LPLVRRKVSVGGVMADLDAVRPRCEVALLPSVAAPII
jgi:hypothetical protein